MVTVYMMVGIPGSGKSTKAAELSSELQCPIISTDVVRNMFPYLAETDIWPRVYKMCIDAILEGQNFIYDATNITPKVRQRFVDEVKKVTSDFNVATYYVKADPKECLKRVIERNKDKTARFLPPEVVDMYASKIIAPTMDEGFIFIKEISN